MSSTVRIDWRRKFDNTQMWNNMFTWTVERFGLPGDRFTCHATVNWMEFVFEDPKDALIMSLRWNAPIVTNQELTVEFIGARL